MARTANLLGAMSAVVTGQVDDVLKEHPNQNASAAAALKLIGAFDGCSNHQLSGALGLSPSATVRLLDRLQSSGLIRRSQGEDRRVVALHLTDEGRVRSAHMLRKRATALERLVGVLSPELRQQLDDVAEVLLRSAVSAPVHAAYICRLCNERRCPQTACPVHLRAEELLAGPAPAASSRPEPVRSGPERANVGHDPKD